MGGADPALHQTKGRNLHDHRVAACLVHPVKQLHQIKRHGGGIVRVDDLVPDLILNGTHQPHLMPIVRENVLDHIGHSGLAVGARDPDHLHFPLRMVKPGGTGSAVCDPGIRHQDLTIAQSQVTLCNHCGCTLFQHLRCCIVAIKPVAPDTEEQTAWLHLPGIVCKTGDFLIRQSSSCFFQYLI